MLSTDPWLDRLHGASILNLFKSLASCGYEVKILLPSNTARRIGNNSFSVLALESRKYVPLLTLSSFFRRAFRHLVTSKSNVLMFDVPMLPLFLFFKILMKKKGIMLILSRSVGEEGFKGWVRSLYFRLALIIGKLFVDAFTAISPFEAFVFSRIGKIPKNKIMIVPSPLGGEFEKFNSPVDKNKLWLKYGLSTLLWKKVLLYQGILDKHRGVLEVLDLFTKSFKGDDRIALLLVGDGPAKDSIKAFIRQNKVSNIILLGPFSYSKMPELIAACDVGLVILPNDPWWCYQTPTKLVEFLALNRQVIVSDLPGIRWIASDSPLVVYLKSLAVYDFKEAVKQILTKRDMVFLGNTRIRQKQIERFSSRSIALKLSQKINSI